MGKVKFLFATWWTDRGDPVQALDPEQPEEEALEAIRETDRAIFCRVTYATRTGRRYTGERWYPKKAFIYADIPGFKRADPAALRRRAREAQKNGYAEWAEQLEQLAEI